MTDHQNRRLAAKASGLLHGILYHWLTIKLV